jgi:hypothetical protein
VHDVGELDRLVVDSYPDVFTSLTDKGSHHRLARFEVTGRQPPDTIFVAGALTPSEQHIARRVD